MNNDTLHRELQLAELQMLKDVATFCDKNDIMYYLYAGTLLGAMRHQGFIPWDDDIDLCMDAKNYRKFLKLAPTGLADKYFIQNFRTEQKAFYPWTQIRMKGTTSAPRDMIDYDIHFGICMDVFIITQYPKSRLGRKLQEIATALMTILVEKHYYAYKKLPLTRSRKLVTQIVPEFCRVPLLRLLERFAYVDLKEADFCFNMDRMNLKTQARYPMSMMDEKKRIKVLFEDDYFWTFGEWETFLERHYGDWRTPPPESSRMGHGDIIIDLHRNYTEYKTKGIL